MTRQERRKLRFDVARAARRSGFTRFDEPWRTVQHRLATRAWRQAAVQAYALINAAPEERKGLRGVNALAFVNSVIMKQIVPHVAAEFQRKSPLLSYLTRTKKGGTF